MVDSAGRVIGINTMVSGGLGLAVPSNQARAFLAAAARPKMGIMVQPVRLRGGPESQTDALLIAEVLDQSPAATAGVLVGDVLMAVDGRAVTGWDDLAARLSTAGRVIHLALLRGERQVSIDLSLDAGGRHQESWRAA